MNADEKKDMVTATIRAMLGGHLDPDTPDVADDVHWVMAKSLASHLPLITTKEQLLARTTGSKGMFPGGLTTDIHNVFCDGDSVIVEMRNSGEAANGKTYDNDYCLVVDLVDDKIQEIREYQDSLHVSQTFFS